MRCEVTRTLERWSSLQGHLQAQNAAYRLAWGTTSFDILWYSGIQMLLALIPFLAFICIFLHLKTRFPTDPDRRVFLHAAIWFACYLALAMEGLSLIHGITRLGLVITWILPILAFSFWAWRITRQGERLVLPQFQIPLGWWNRALLIMITTILMITALVAWVTPPQTWDSLTYHLSRVAHWAQDRSIWHFATGIDRQTSMPPGAEEQILNTYVLTQSDRLANFPEWFAMLGSLVGVSVIAYYLGAKSTGQWLAAAFAATIPMGIVEASSTINDYVATFWVVCVVVEVVAYSKQGENRSLFYLILAAGLALLTKPIAVPFLIPFALWLAFLLLKRRGIVPLLKWGAIAILIVVLLNGGYLARNVITYGALSNPVDFETHYNQLHSVQGLIVTLLKNIGVQVGLPYLPQVNDAWNLLILKTSVKLGLDINDPRMTAVGYFRVSPPTTAEDTSSNPLHAYLIFALFIASFFLAKKRGWSQVVYPALVAATFILFSFIYKWNVFGTRYDLAFFVLFAPAAGIIFEALDRYKVGYSVTLLLLVGCLPWLLSISSRPLIARPGHTDIARSISVEPRQNLYFANASVLQDSYTQMAGKIKSAGCSDIGIMLLGDDPEYLIWEIMGAPRSHLNIDWIVSSPTTRYEQVNFLPCAVICNKCDVNQSVRGNRFVQEFSGYQLFLKP